jgi:hypothetical protein
MAMGDFDAVRKIKDLKLPDAERELILCGNAARALKL